MRNRIVWLTAVLLIVFSGICTDSVLAELIGYWPFEEGQGTETADITGNGNDGIFNGNVEWVPGYIGDGVHFDDAGERVVIGPLDPTEGTNAMTLAAWIFWEGQGHSREHQGIIGKRLGWNPDNDHPTPKWFWETTPTGDLTIRRGGGALAWGWREIVPRLADVLLYDLDRRVARRRTPAVRQGTPFNGSSARGGGRGRRRRRRRRGGS